MKIMRFMRTTATAAVATLALTGTALAASDVSLDTTGPDSNNEVKINQATTITTSNTNVVHVTNENVQFAETGDVSASKNTSVEGVLGSGDAANANTTSTVVSINNPAVGGLGDVVTPGATPGGSNVGGVGGAQPVGGRGGSSLGASTGGLGGGVAMLPEVGASSSIDVSALRAAWQPATDAPTTNMVKQARGFTTLMLVVAALLSLLGALGSVLYARRKEGGV